MKLKFLSSIFLLLFFIAPSYAQQEAISSLAGLEKVKQALNELALSKDQIQALSSIIVAQLPRIVDSNSDPLSLAFEVGPQIEGLLNPAQKDAFGRLAQEALPVILQLSSMDKIDRQLLIKNELDKLNFPGIKEWLNRSKSLES